MHSWQKWNEKMSDIHIEEKIYHTNFICKMFSLKYE